MDSQGKLSENKCKGGVKGAWARGCGAGDSYEGGEKPGHVKKICTVVSVTCFNG